MTSMVARSAPAGWTIMAASTPAKAPRSAKSTLPAPPSSAGVPRMRTRPPASPARPARARPAPRPAAAMTLWPQAWPMPGRASYSQHTATTGPSVPASALKAVGNPKAPAATATPSRSSTEVSRSWAKCSS